MSNDFTIQPLGETGILVNFGHTISPKIHAKIKKLADYLDVHSFTGMIEYVISYTSVAIYFNPYLVKKAVMTSSLTYRDKSAQYIVTQIVKQYIMQAKQLPEKPARVVEIPVCYGQEYGPDIEFVAKHNKLSVEEVIEIHTKPQYLVYMIGFCPGFPYLGGMDKRIATPRRDTPRLSIPARSIGIAGEQTGGYPINTPGGWQIIGRTPLEMFDINKEKHPSLLQSGDLVKFKAISAKEYADLREEILHES